MNDRIRALRKDLGLSQAKFAERIGASASAVANYETGVSTPLKPIITAICKEFNVSESWLRTGDGEMYMKDLDEFSVLAKAHPNLTDDSLTFIRRFVELPPMAQDAVWTFLTGLVGEMQAKAARGDKTDEELTEEFVDHLKNSDEKKSSPSSDTSPDTA